MSIFNKDGSIKLPADLVKNQEGSRNTKLRYDNLFEKARGKRIKVLFILENPSLTKNVYSDTNETSDNPLTKLFDILKIKKEDINAALEDLLDKGFFILYLQKNQYKTPGFLKASLFDLKPQKIVAVGELSAKNERLFFDDGINLDEKVELDDLLPEKIKAIIKDD